MKNYPWQERFWKRWDQTGSPRRILISAPTGAGKTRAAAQLFSQYPRVIITGPGLALEPWKRDVPGLVQLETGPRAGLSKKAQARNEAALQAPAVFMTPALLPKWSDKFPPAKRQLLVLDEAHMYDAPETKRSEWLAVYLAAHPLTDALALTATYMRKEIRDVWSLANIFAPEEFYGKWEDGEHRRIAYSFLSSYCQRDPDMGFFFGARLDKLPALKDKLRSFVEFIEPEEILMTVPKAQPNLSPAPRQELIDDLVSSPAESKCIMFQHQEVAEAFAANIGWPVLHSGTHLAAKRVEALAELRKAYSQGKSANFVGCWGSFSEAVSLAWVEQTLIFEPPTTPGQIEQLMGRFQRPEPAQRVPAIVTFEASPAAMKRLKTLTERANQAEGVQGMSPKTAGLLQMVKDHALAPVALSLAADYDPDIEYAIRFIDGEFDDESGDLG